MIAFRNQSKTQVSALLMLTTKLGALGRNRAPYIHPFLREIALRKNYTLMEISVKTVSFGNYIQALKETSAFTGGSSNALILTK